MTTHALPRRDDAPRTLVVAGLWARPLAESARQGGWQVIALDLFGDVDTRRASMHWAPIGEASTLRIDPARLRQELQRAARHPRVDGWVPASGFEGAPELLAAGGPALPCLAIEPSAMKRVRDPAGFFGTLDRLRLPHPRICLDMPRRPDRLAGRNAARGRLAACTSAAPTRCSPIRRAGTRTPISSAGSPARRCRRCSSRTASASAWSR